MSEQRLMMRAIEADLGRTFLTMRSELKLSQQDIARAIGVHPTGLGQKEAGKTGITYGEAVLWSAALGEPIDPQYRLPPLCPRCFNNPPTGFTCNVCQKGNQ